MQGRGLEHAHCLARARHAIRSRPSCRGVDWNFRPILTAHRFQVAPHAGAWIGTPLLPIYEGGAESPLMQGRGLEPLNAGRLEVERIVAPHAGAWIGTPQELPPRHRHAESPLMQGRGLEPGRHESAFRAHPVAPHAGAWIGTCSGRGARPDVDVAPHAGAWIGTNQSSHNRGPPPSPLMQGRGLEHWEPARQDGLSAVAPHAGAWIGTRHWRRPRRPTGVAPHAGAWIGTSEHSAKEFAGSSRPSCRGVDWNINNATID